MASVLIDMSKIKREQAPLQSSSPESVVKDKTYLQSQHDEQYAIIAKNIRKEMHDFYGQKLEDEFKRGYQKCIEDTEEANRANRIEIDDKINKLVAAEKLLCDAANMLFQAKKELYTSAKNELLEIVFEAIGRIVCEDFLKSKDRVEFLLNSIMERHNLDDKLKIKFHPEDFDIIKSCHPSFVENNVKIKVTSCNSQELGGVTLISENGELDLKLSTKLQQFQQLLIRHSEESKNV